MDQNTKQRLVGITVIFALAVIFLPMILDGSGVRKNTLEVVIPPQPVASFNPEFDQKIVELQAKVDDLPNLEPQFIDESSATTNKKTVPESEAEKAQQADRQTQQPAAETVTQTATRIAQTGGDTWVLQVGSYKDRTKALSQRDQLRKSNIAAVFVEQFSIDNAPIYRVRLGPFVNRDQSKVALNKVKAKYDIDGLIMKYNK